MTPDDKSLILDLLEAVPERPEALARANGAGGLEGRPVPGSPGPIHGGAPGHPTFDPGTYFQGDSVPKFYLIAIGELEPDFLSKEIQDYLTHKYLRPVNWSHIGILVEGAGERFDGVWDSTGRGFRRCSLEEALDHGESVIRHKIRLDVASEERALGWLLGNKDRWYSNLQYVMYFIPDWAKRYLGWILPKFIKERFANGRGMAVCSETGGYFIVDNCPGAETNETLTQGDVLDPYAVVWEALKYSVPNG